MADETKETFDVENEEELEPIVELEATGELEAVDEIDMDDDAFVVLADEAGEEVEFEYIGSVDYEGDEYVVLLPVEDEEDAEEPDEAEVLILKVESLGTVIDEETGEEYEDEQYVSVDDEDTLDKVFEIFKEENADNFEFIDED